MVPSRLVSVVPQARGMFSDDSPYAQLSKDHPFGSATVSFAVDVSGSTYGGALRAEKIFIRDVSSFLSPQSQLTAKVLPWASGARRVRKLSQLNTLTSDGYTVPEAIIEDPAHKDALMQSSLWFLLTDGLVDDEHRIRFSKLIAESGLHGNTCVTVIFGKPGTCAPSSCNISVGVSVFAVVPNCLFLYYNTSNNEIMIMQCKGIFKSLLEGAENPVIDDYTSWASFPRLSVRALSSLIIPPAKKLDKDEIALQDGLVIKYEELLNNRLSQDQVAKILSNEDNITSVVMTAQSRSQAGRFQNWVQKQQIHVDDPSFKERPDLGGNASASFREVLAMFKAGCPINERVQSRLRGAYAANMGSFVQQIQDKREESQRRSSVIASSSSRASSCISSAASLSPTPSYGSSGYQSGGYGFPSDQSRNAASARAPSSSGNNYYYSTPQHQSLTGPPAAPVPAKRPLTHRFRPPREETYETWTKSATDPQIRHLLYTPEFRNKNGSFTGTCPLCGARNTTLAWLFHAQLTQLNTPGFPPLWSSSNLAFPLAMGNFPETDILSATICCDPCSAFCVNLGISPDPQTIVKALPMVSYSENRLSYQNVLYQALGGRFAKGCLPQVFLSILITALDVASDPVTPDTSLNRVFHEAVRWTYADLVANSTAPVELSASFSVPATQSLEKTLDIVLNDSFRGLNDGNSPIVRYPLEGFSAVLYAAAIASVPVDLRCRALFRRYLYLLSESYKAIRPRQPTSEGLTLAAARAKTMTDLLWSDSDMDALGRTVTPAGLAQGDVKPLEDKKDPLPKIPILTSDLQGTAILGERALRSLRTATEFSFLEGDAACWVGPATAAFLHAMVILDTSSEYADAWDLFNAVMNLPELGAISVHPESVKLDVARAMVEALRK
ncbi:hypothetical protein FGG08_006657 [Glutinoglossum americanum]|uniref:Uncharacterized protein n=1 Tax=Glutinoglossum americanum TaxID=1670608 RepID=A0A9P8I127_9PEZI|nr:hypothetical protein FGG08_006657 [Glutinoglossum americanum]